MSSCSEFRSLFGPLLEHEAGEAQTDLVRDHLAECPDCAELFEAMQMIVDAGELVQTIEPPPNLETDLSASPCNRWLGLLYQAVDREISQDNLERLLTHLEKCPTCRQAWHDLTLIHQVSDAMVPPNHLLQKCLTVRDRLVQIPILGRRTATAAAYVLALLTSLAIGNPTIIAQDFQAVAAERVSKAAAGVSEVAADGRGEVRVLLWRAMRWGETRIDTVRGWVDRLRDNDETDAASDEEPGPSTEPTPQGEKR